MHRTKIVATTGPSSSDEKTLRAMIDAGMDVARRNFSHGTHDEHRDALELIHGLSDTVAVMMDTQGPEVRLRDVADGTTIVDGDMVRITTMELTGDAERLAVDHPDLLDHLEKGDTLLIGDGDIELEVERIEDDAVCRVVYGGRVFSRKSVSVPGKQLGLEGLTEKDVEDVQFAAAAGFDLIAVSFVHTADDIRQVRELTEPENPEIQIIAKIERFAAIEHLPEIIEAADGVMVARGDLGVDVPASRVPILQKQIIRDCNLAGKPVIVATQMLQSMTDHPRATRAEISDVANAVMDGTDAVMLSEETAVGAYPVKAVEVMAETASSMEERLNADIPHTVKSTPGNIADVIAKSVWQAARDIDAAYIIAHTSSGYTARNIAKYRPGTDIIAFTDSRTVQRQLSLVWGVDAHYMAFPDHVDDMIIGSTQRLKEKGLVADEDILVMSAGVPTSVSGTTNMMEIRSVQNILEPGTGQDD